MYEDTVRSAVDAGVERGLLPEDVRWSIATGLAAGRSMAEIRADLASSTVSEAVFAVLGMAEVRLLDPDRLKRMATEWVAGLEAAESERAEIADETVGDWDYWTRTLDRDSPCLLPEADHHDARDRWWLPSLLFLELQLNREAESEGHATLRSFTEARRDAQYILVEEITDGIAGLTVHPWPLVDDRGRLRFPTTFDPLQIELPVPVLQDVVNANRAALAESGIVPEGLATRLIQFGDVFAGNVYLDEPTNAFRRVESSDTVELETLAWEARDYWPDMPNVGVAWVAEAVDDDQRLHAAGTLIVGGLRLEDRPLPMLDVSWDARKAGKLSYSACNSGTAGEGQFREAYERAAHEDLQRLAKSEEVD